MELIDLVNSAQISSNLTFLLGFLTVTLTVLLFWISFFFPSLVFVLQWLSIHWEILIMFFSQFLLTFHQTLNETPHFIAKLLTILELIRMVFVIIWEMFHGRISLNSMLHLLQKWVQFGIAVRIWDNFWIYQANCVMKYC